MKTLIVILMMIRLSNVASAQTLKREELKILRDKINFNVTNRCLDGKAQKEADRLLERIEPKAAGDLSDVDTRRLVKARGYVMKGKFRKGSDCAKDFKRAVDELDKVLAEPEPETKPATTGEVIQTGGAGRDQ